MPFPSRFWKGGRKPYHTWARYNPINSQVSSASSATAGFAYDQAGNVIFDGLNNYWYNAEGQLCAVQQSSTITAYSYDAEGRRVAKGTLSGLPAGDVASQTSVATSGTCGPISSATSSFTLTSRYLLDLGGNQVTELNGAGNWVHTNILAAGGWMQPMIRRACTSTWPIRSAPAACKRMCRAVSKTAS